MTNDRRTFLKLAAGAAGLSALPLSLQKALAQPAKTVTGTIKDVEHVVILMQENRSFDHYFGTLRGVRGFDDPRAVTLPGGKPVWYQPRTPGDPETVTPFHLDTATTSAQTTKSLDHFWKKSFALWKNHDAWVQVKSAMTMGYFTRADIPFYHALADAFTVGDAYHCSIFASTGPNRLFLFSGTSGLSVGYGDYQVVNNALEANEDADMAKDTPSYASLGWTTYAERLQKAGIDWRVYQERDNYGDNALAYFSAFRGPNADPDLIRRGRSWVDGSTEENAKSSRGEHLIAAFAKDVANDALPQVSWIVAPYIMCEHPEAPPGYGESFTARMLEALAANPDVFAKTVFILNYDENDGFFDHVPPLVPAIHPSIGQSTADTRAENYFWEPVGFGPRVPLIIVSPWTRGGYVNSELSDHTSVIRFLEQRFGVMEPNISPWRRAVAGDLTSMFDFAQADDSRASLPDTTGTMARVEASAKLPPAKQFSAKALPKQERGQRPARALPYDFDVTGAPASGGFKLTFTNRGRAGAGFTVYSAAAGEGPWVYMVEAGKSLSDIVPIAGTPDLSVHGSNGFFRQFRGAAPIAVAMRYDASTQSAVLTVQNSGASAAKIAIRNGYADGKARSHDLAANAQSEDHWPIAQSDHWYDFTITQGNKVVQRLAGHIETGRPSKSDPAIGRG